MRCVNRKQLLMVVVFAAIFGAVLPYLELVFIVPLYAAKMSNAQPIDRDGYSVFQCDLLIVDWATVLWRYNPPSEKSWPQVRADCFDAVPQNVFDTRFEGVNAIIVHRYGWPFRGVQMCFVRGTGGKLATEAAIKGRELGWAWADTWLPVYWPVGIIWRGIAGNICASVLVLGGLYAGVSYWRTSRRIRRGMCLKCGYLSRGAAVCPECGVGVKA